MEGEEVVAKEQVVAMVARKGERATNIAIDRKRGYGYVVVVSGSPLYTPSALYRVPLAMNASQWTDVLVTMKELCKWPPGLVGMCASYMGYSITEEQVVRRELKLDAQCSNNPSVFTSKPRSVIVHPPSGDLIVCFITIHNEGTPFARIRVSTGECWLLENKSSEIPSCAVVEYGAEGRLLSPDLCSEIVFLEDQKHVDVSLIHDFHNPSVSSNMICAAVDDHKTPPDGCYMDVEFVAYEKDPMMTPLLVAGQKVCAVWKAQRTRKGYPDIELPGWASLARMVAHDGKNGWIIHLTRERISKKMKPSRVDLSECKINLFENDRSVLVRVEWHPTDPITTSVTPLITLPSTVPATGLHLSSDWAFWIDGSNRLCAVSL